MIKHELEKEHVDFLVKSHSRHLTAYSVVLEAKGKDRSILVYKGASSFLHPEEIPKGLSANWFYFASVVGTSFKTMDTLSRIAKRNKIDIFFNPSEYMIVNGGKLMKDIVSATTILSLNKEEAQLLTKNRSGNTRELLKSLKAFGPSVCIITNGKEGVHAYDGKEFYFRKARRMYAADTTGAGDAFGAGFLGGWLLNDKLQQEKRMDLSLKMGLLNSESVISFVGAKKGLLHRKNMIEQLGGYNANHK
jgi:fructokinase